MYTDEGSFATAERGRRTFPLCSALARHRPIQRRRRKL